MPGYIYYRGDTRDPAVIFPAGFDKRYPMCPIQFRTVEFPGTAGDVNPPTAVCLTRRFEIAPLFPIGNNDPRYIYAIYIDDSEIFETRDIQIQQAKTEIENVMLTGVARENVNELDIGWPLFGYECATDRVPNHTIIGAVHCTILNRFNNDMQVTYICDSPRSSIRCTLPIPIRAMAMNRLVQGVLDGMKSSPHPGTGFGGLTI